MGRPSAQTLGRCFWALMCGMHAFALAAVWRSLFDGGLETSELAGCFTLSLSVAFFLLKVAGVSFLRINPSKRAWVAACLLVAWIHVDCVDPNLTGILSGDCADLIVSTVLIGGLTQIPERVRATLDRSVCVYNSRISSGRSFRTVWLDDSQPRCWVLASRLYSLRAPPV